MKPQMTASRWIIDPPPPPAKPLTDDERLDKIITFLEGAYGFACEAAEPEAFCVADTLRSIEQHSESKPAPGDGAGGDCQSQNEAANGMKSATWKD